MYPTVRLKNHHIKEVLLKNINIIETDEEECGTERSLSLFFLDISWTFLGQTVQKN